MTLSLLCQIISSGFQTQPMVVIGSLSENWQTLTHGSHLIHTPAIANEVALMCSHGY